MIRLGGGGLLGLGLSDYLSLKASAMTNPLGLGRGPGWGKAKSVILVFLQGGPSHIDLWDPKDGAPDDVRSVFKTIPSSVDGMEVTELLPRLAQETHRFTFVRSMSYQPVGLFNHTAAHYQMLTGYTADKVSPSGQLEPPSPKDFPNVGCNIIKMRPPEEATLPYVMLPRPLQESNIIGKAGTAGFLGRAFDPYTLYPPGNDDNQDKLQTVQASDLVLRPELTVNRLERRARLRDIIESGMPAVEHAVANYDLDEYAAQALELILSGRSRKAFAIEEETDAMRDRYGRSTFGQSCLLARRLVEAGTRFVQVNWPKVANSDKHSWDCHVDLEKRMRDQAAPMFDPGIATLIADLDERGLLESTLVVAVGEFGRSPRKGLSTSGNSNDTGSRDHWPYCFTSLVAGAGIKRGYVHGESDTTGSAPLRDAVHPTDLLATIYHAVGIDPTTEVLNHLNQPRELVKGSAVLDLFQA
ncbi:MAG: hypothetical protein ACI8QS_003561 [Planctomycetota bacterium]